MKLIYTTVKDIEEAKKMAKTLVEEKLAACVNFFPLESVYKWKNELLEEAEVGMFIKTKDALTGKVMQKIKKLHSYDTPCILCLNIDKVDKDYLKWVET